jgi:hypothetical protein
MSASTRSDRRLSFITGAPRARIAMESIPAAIDLEQLRNDLLEGTEEVRDLHV